MMSQPRFAISFFIGILILGIIFVPHAVVSQTVDEEDQVGIEEPVTTEETAPFIQDTHTVQGPWEDRFEQQVKEWIDQIAHQDEQFTSWKQANWDSYPMGPGSRQWVVLLVNKGQEVGYLIVGQADDDHHEFVLMEYGQQYQQSLQGWLEEPYESSGPILYAGLFWGYEVDNVLHDFFTHEAYEHIETDIVVDKPKGAKVDLLQKVHRVDKDQGTSMAKISGSVSDINGSPMDEVDKEDLSQHDIHHTVTDAAIFDATINTVTYLDTYILPQVRAIYDVVGFHVWEKGTPHLDQGPTHLKERTEQPMTLFVGLEDAGIRYLGLQYLTSIETDTK
ncbi:hypothetical protein [Caldalkalibacillus salinus]|uniref:hypothetical protein n=1 Tax=Caldalkalibacillus salinus TaxID=2803787 RepID=UPI0019250A10|nr:hypothetical protein [Caldalkalibacillus salinus]